MSNIEIQKLLVLSVDHLKHDTRAMCEALVPVPWEPQVRHPFGWDWYVPSASADISDYPDEFCAIFDLARVHDCTWVRFDADGPVLDDLSCWDGTSRAPITKGGR